MNTFNELLAYIATNITDAGASYRILPAMVRNSFNWFIDLVREHTEDPAIHVTQEDKDAITAHISNNDIHLDPADKTKWDNTASNFAVHDANAIIHVTQAEKNTWNAKAVIKGLESGLTEIKYGFNFNNAPNNSTYIAQDSVNLPVNNEFVLVTTNTSADTGVQIANYFISRKIYQRFLGAGTWQPWQLISAPKMFATGYIDSVTFNGTTGVTKSVLFDDGVTRNVSFRKVSDYIYSAGTMTFAVHDISARGLIKLNDNRDLFCVNKIMQNPSNSICNLVQENDDFLILRDILITTKISL